MFLSKKTPTNNINKSKNTQTKHKKILGGWQDDEEKQTSHPINNGNIYKQTNLLQSDSPAEVVQNLPPKIQPQQKQYFDWDELNEKDDIECEKKLVQEIVQPGGIRIKPTDTMLSQFIKQIKGMEVFIIGSLILSKIQVNYPFQIKAKALYTIEFLCKKSSTYLAYFKKYVQKIQAFPEPQDNIQSYRKILKAFLNYIGVSTNSINAEETQKHVFADPGYNDQPKKSSLSNFIEQNTVKPTKVQPKKSMIGPGQNKSKAVQVKQQNRKLAANSKNADLLDEIDLVFNTVSNNKGNDLLQSQTIGKTKQISFDDLLTGEPIKPGNSTINLLY